jgi:hypothetical protein
MEAPTGRVEVEEEAVGQGRGSPAGGGSKLQMRRDGRPAADARQGREERIR